MEDPRARRFGSLDGLRALAVLAVVWHHSPAGRGWRGYLGVDLFFVLSGFLITTLLLRERERHGAVHVGPFLVRRALRLFPLYYLLLASLALVFGLVAPGAAMADAFFADLPWYATYTSNWIHAGTFLALAWSLAAEEQFYVAWAPLLRALGDGARWVAWGVLVIGLAVTFGWLDGPLASLLGPRFRELDMVQATFDPIALGCLAAWWLRAPRGSARLLRGLLHSLLQGRLAAPLAALAIVVAASVPETGGLRFGRPVVQVAMTALVVACVVREDNGLAPLLRLRPLAQLGKVSYGVYLLHMVTLQGVRPWVEARDLPDVALFAANALAAWAAATVSYHLVERHFLRLRARYRPSSTP